ncbi:unnamed protein product [Prorocentrum cordatum]|uniref:Anaphase-promoting complex subunit 1 n=1 Tax=Prorocentrum cordatum TaxID=2364126 RepID=A0ABN9TM88_9DINO|nr:unnamed protein product [Polarella glacialis]
MPPTPQGRLGRPQMAVTSLDEDMINTPADRMPAYMISTPTDSVLDGMFPTPRGESLSWPRPASPMLQMGRLHQAGPLRLSLSDAIGTFSDPPLGAAAPTAAPTAVPALQERSSGRAVRLVRTRCRAAALRFTGTVPASRALSSTERGARVASIASSVTYVSLASARRARRSGWP